MIDQSRFNFMTGAHIWYSRASSGSPQAAENRIVLSDEFYREVMAHPIPTDLEAAKALAGTPAALDLFAWLSYRCFTAKGRERVPLFGASGLVQQLGTGDYARPRKFRERLAESLDVVNRVWPECPAKISEDGGYLVVSNGTAVHQR